MLSGNELYVIVKLVSGEQLMAVLTTEDENYIELDSPMTIRMIPVLQENREHITANPFCQFSNDTKFILDKRNVIFIKKMHHVFIPHYQRIVAEHERSAFVTKDDQGVVREKKLQWEDEEDFINENETIEEIQEKIKMLQDILGQEPEEEKKEETYRYFVEGNDTIN